MILRLRVAVADACVGLRRVGLVLSCFEIAQRTDSKFLNIPPSGVNLCVSVSLARPHYRYRSSQTIDTEAVKL